MVLTVYFSSIQKAGLTRVLKCKVYNPAGYDVAAAAAGAALRSANVGFGMCRGCWGLRSGWGYRIDTQCRGSAVDHHF